MTRSIIDVVLHEKTQYILEIDAELLNPELAETHNLLREEQYRIIEGELEQLALECADYWECAA